MNIKTIQELKQTNLTPQQIVKELDKYIIGQDQAKRIVAIALRNRLRRRLLSESMREEVTPKNIILIGPTGVGKTEIARRLAALTNAPFIKVEASKYTEVGYVGRDVESMIRDLVQQAVNMVREEKFAEVREKAEAMVNEQLVDMLVPVYKHKKNIVTADDELSEEEQQRKQRYEEAKIKVNQQLVDGELEDESVEMEAKETGMPMMEIFSGNNMEELGINIQDMLQNIVPGGQSAGTGSGKTRKYKISEARRILVQEELNKHIDMTEIKKEAVKRTEEMGIVFIDELDKVAGKDQSRGPDVSREGVQRDLLPIVEGTMVNTRNGEVRTNHILFIAAGAFHVSKPADLIPELQGRFPLRAELTSLRAEDFERILTEPKQALTKQYRALMETEEIELEFSKEAISKMAEVAFKANEMTEDIGARRLHTVIERILEEVSFNASDMPGNTITITPEYIEERIGDLLKEQDLGKYIL